MADDAETHDICFWPMDGDDHYIAVTKVDPRLGPHAKIDPDTLMGFSFTEAVARKVAEALQKAYNDGKSDAL